MAKDSDEFSLEQIEKNRKLREERAKKKKERKSLALAQQFEEGVSILGVEPDEKGVRKIKRDKFFEILSYDLEESLCPEDFTSEELITIRRGMSKYALAPSSTVIMRCPGRERCSFAETCEFARVRKEPEGKACPKENILFSEMLAKHTVELDVDPSNSLEMAYCNELAATDLLIMRMNMMLAKQENSTLTHVNVTVGRDSTTEELIVSPYLESRDRLVKRRERLIKLMVGDRQEQYKKQAALKLKDENSESIMQSRKANLIIEAKMKKDFETKEQDAKEAVSPEDILFDSFDDDLLEPELDEEE